MSEKVYNVILDCKLMNEEEEYLEPTISALVSCFGADEGKSEATTRTTRIPSIM